jgi:hypothetical protein
MSELLAYVSESGITAGIAYKDLSIHIVKDQDGVPTVLWDAAAYQLGKDAQQRHCMAVAGPGASAIKRLLGDHEGKIWQVTASSFSSEQLDTDAMGLSRNLEALRAIYVDTSAERAERLRLMFPMSLSGMSDFQSRMTVLNKALPESFFDVLSFINKRMAISTICKAIKATHALILEEGQSYLIDVGTAAETLLPGIRPLIHSLHDSPLQPFERHILSHFRFSGEDTFEGTVSVGSNCAQVFVARAAIEARASLWLASHLRLVSPPGARFLAVADDLKGGTTVSALEKHLIVSGVKLAGVCDVVDLLSFMVQVKRHAYTNRDKLDFSINRSPLASRVQREKDLSTSATPAPSEETFLDGLPVSLDLAGKERKEAALRRSLTSAQLRAVSVSTAVP